MDIKPIIYTDCDFMPIYNFFKIVNTGDLIWLYDRKTIPFDFTPTEDLKPTWEAIYTQALNLLGDKEALYDFSENITVQQMQLEYNTVMAIVKLIEQGLDTKHITTLNESIKLFKKSYSMDLTKPLHNEVARVKRLLGGLKFKIEAKALTLKKDNTEKTEIEIFDELTQLALRLGKDRISPYDTVVSEWISLKKIKTNG